MLKFSPANAKTKALYLNPKVYPFLAGRRKVYSLDLSSGHSCPGAKKCKSMVIPRPDNSLKFTIKDGRHCQFRCFSASQEVLYPAVRKLRQHNLNVLRQTRGWKQCCDMLAVGLPNDCGVLRYHVSGDFFKAAYLLGAIELAKMRPHVLFYTYTKSLHFLDQIAYRDNKRHKTLQLPPNFRVTVSRGGKYDYLIRTLGIRESVVVHSEEDAALLGLPLDHNDSHAATTGGSFALLLHGVQPAGTSAAKALYKLQGRGSYARR